MLLGVILAFFAQILLGGALVVDKILLGKSRSIGGASPVREREGSQRAPVSNGAGKNRGEEKIRLVSFVFWIGIFDLVGLFLIPFGFNMPRLSVVAIALVAGVAFFISILAYYKALIEGEASETLAVVGGFAPIAAYLLSTLIIIAPLNLGERIAFAFLAGGGFLMFGSEKLSMRKALPWVLLASLAIGASDTLQKLAFLDANFVTGYVLMKIGTALAAASLLLFPAIRKEIGFSSTRSTGSYRLVYLLNRAMAGMGSIIVFYAIKLDHPALIEAVNGTRYVIIFLLGLLITWLRPQWLKENFSGRTLAIKIMATIVITLGLIGLGTERYYESIPKIPDREITWGITYSELMAKHLGLNSRAALGAIINDLHPKALRLIAYWDMIEPQKDTWDFMYLDSQFSQAAQAHIPVILVVGQKVPRWPECHSPTWAQNQNVNLKNQNLLDYLKVVVEHYRGNPWLNMWQVENEPFLNFGVCPPRDTAFLDKEIALVRSLDPNHRIFETDGGEFGDWRQAAARADVFGPTLYRIVDNRFFGHITYPITPEFYGLRESINKWLTGKPDQKYVVSELGLEPWTVKQIYEIPVSEQLSLFSPQNFDDIVQFARATQFDTFYLWGAEWWYSLKLQGNSTYWNKAKAVIASGLH